MCAETVPQDFTTAIDEVDERVYLASCLRGMFGMTRLECVLTSSQIWKD